MNHITINDLLTQLLKSPEFEKIIDEKINEILKSKTIEKDTLPPPKLPEVPVFLEKEMLEFAQMQKDGKSTDNVEKIPEIIISKEEISDNSTTNSPRIEKTEKQYKGAREICPYCKRSISKTNLNNHKSTQHKEEYKKEKELKKKLKNGELNI